MFRELVIFAYFAMIRIITEKSSLDTKTTKDNAETIRRSLKLPAAKFLKQQSAKNYQLAKNTRYTICRSKLASLP